LKRVRLNDPTKERGCGPVFGKSPHILEERSRGPE